MDSRLRGKDGRGRRPHPFILNLQSHPLILNLLKDENYPKNLIFRNCPHPPLHPQNLGIE